MKNLGTIWLGLLWASHGYAFNLADLNQANTSTTVNSNLQPDVTRPSTLDTVDTSVGSGSAVKEIDLSYQNMVSANPALAACTHPPSTPYNPASPPTATVSNYPCVAPTTPATVASPTAATWIDRLYNAAGTEMTGTYRKDGVKCAGAGVAPTTLCPIQVLAKFSLTCNPNTSQTIGGVNRCQMLDTFAVNHITQLAVPIPNTPPLKPILVGPGGAAPIVIPASSFISTIFASYTCPNGGVSQGKDKYGYPICDGGTITNAIAADSAAITTNATKEAADNAAIRASVCELEKKQVDLSGGTTTSCDTPYTVIKLRGLQRTIADCAQARGTIVDENAPFAAILNPDVSQNGHLLCKLNGSSCSFPWQSTGTPELASTTQSCYMVTLASCTGSTGSHNCSGQSIGTGMQKIMPDIGTGHSDAASVNIQSTGGLINDQICTSHHDELSRTLPETAEAYDLTIDINHCTGGCHYDASIVWSSSPTSNSYNTPDAKYMLKAVYSHVACY